MPKAFNLIKERVTSHSATLYNHRKALTMVAKHPNKVLVVKNIYGVNVPFYQSQMEVKRSIVDTISFSSASIALDYVENALDVFICDAYTKLIGKLQLLQNTYLFLKPELELVLSDDGKVTLAFIIKACTVRFNKDPDLTIEEMGVDLFSIIKTYLHVKPDNLFLNILGYDTHVKTNIGGKPYSNSLKYYTDSMSTIHVLHGQLFDISEMVIYLFYELVQKIIDENAIPTTKLKLLSINSNSRLYTHKDGDVWKLHIDLYCDLVSLCNSY